MSNLFVIGNGFDIDHKLPTKYVNFHEYLIENYPNAVDKDVTFDISGREDQHGSIQFDEDEVVAFLIDLISRAEVDGEYWQDIETSLGHLDYDQYFDEMSYLYDNDHNSDSYEWELANIYEGVASNFRLVTLKIKELFAEWINTIDIDEVEPKESFCELLDPYIDHFLTFNYTSVLEEVYGAMDVEHIHGMQRSDIIIGHGICGRDFQSGPTGTEWELSQIHDSLRKDTRKIIEQKQDFFNDLTSIEKIYSYGFSFSSVDLPYIEEICDKLDTTNIIWFLHDFSSEEVRDGYKKIIRQCGFKGEFEVFSVNEKDVNLK
ncbi:bacteriophage abortive infection AbiH family protein [Bacillus cereus]